jgi:flagellar hook-length control protein FliK
MTNQPVTIQHEARDALPRKQEHALKAPIQPATAQGPDVTQAMKAVSLPVSRIDMPLAPSVLTVERAPGEAHSVLDNGKLVSLETDFRMGLTQDVARSQEFTAVPRAFAGSDARQADLARQIAIQIAQNANPGGGSVVDLHLTPEELGSLKFRMSLSESGLNIVIQADRPETQDLIRRHFDQLQEQFASLGLGDTSISFSDRTSSEEEPDDTHDNETIHGVPNEKDSQNPHQVITALRLGVDIRI